MANLTIKRLFDADIISKQYYYKDIQKEIDNILEEEYNYIFGEHEK